MVHAGPVTHEPRGQPIENGSPPDSPIVMLLGPTASGKSAIAQALAHRLPIEIISVDSAQVYRGMDIGTAKPSPQERAAVPHHLIDLIDPRDTYSAARFAADARQLIHEIRARQRIPLLVGGTMLYAKALADGLNKLPAADPAVRVELDRRAAEIGWPEMHRQLAAVDPVTAARLHPTDSQRIQRALEVWELTGSPMSALFDTSRGTPGAGGPPIAFSRIALEPAERSQLHRSIANRFDRMLQEGLVHEVQTLRARGDLDAAMPSMRCVGYRQAWHHLDGRYSLEILREKAITATRQLAKRQLTWLRSMPDRFVIDCQSHDVAGAVLRRLQQLRIAD